MPKLFSVLSWNVEHFKLPDTDEQKVAEHIKSFNPDVFAVYEVEGKDVYSFMVKDFPSHGFHLTEGPESQEILVGVHKKLNPYMFTQRTEFQAGNTKLRPGALLSFKRNGEDYTLLFMHTKSSSLPVGLGLRDEMFRHAFNLKKALDKAQGKPANFLFMGDLNTMGMQYPFNRSIDAEVELDKLEQDARRRKMKRLTKTHKGTWTDGAGGYADSNLDQVVASDHLKFRQWPASGGNAEADPADVKVDGWCRWPEGAPQFKQWITEVSDHNSLYLEAMA